MRRAAGIGLLVLLIAASGMFARGYFRPDARAEAERIFERAEDAALDGRSAEQLDLLFEALDYDPTYTPALAEIVLHPLALFYSNAGESRFARLIARVPDADLGTCMTRFVQMRRERYPPLAVRSEAARECASLLSVAAVQGFNPDKTWYPKALALRRKYPGSPAIAVFTKDAILAKGDTAAGRAYAVAMVDSRDPLVRAVGFAFLHMLETSSGPANPRARAHAAALRSLARWPQALLRYDIQASGSRLLATDSLIRYGDRYAAMVPLYNRALFAYGDGRLRESERRWKQLMAAYPDVRGLYAVSRTYLGRTYMKAGRLREAEVELLAAREMSLQDSTPSNLIQAEHNLFHVYEGMGDSVRALASGRAYLEASRPWEFMSARMMAHHDLGWYQWRLGNYHEARALLEGMLAVLDSLGTDQHFAGEYYERIGDLQRALRVYNRTAQTDRFDYRSVARRALIAAQMGDRRGAIHLAEMHDTALGPGYPEFTPQLPAILARFGMLDSALHAAERATSRARERSQAAAVANLMLERATLELKLGRPGRAQPLADSAARFAHDVGAFETEMVAHATRALAVLRASGDVRELERIATLADEAARAKLPLLELQLRTLLGDAHAAAHQHPAALSAYAAAAALNDRIASTLASDADRARYRSAANDVSGKALSLSVARNAPADFIEWSVRRKAHGLRTATRSLRRPGPGEAILDYVVLDSVTAVMVTTSSQKQLYTLRIAPRALTEAVQTLQQTLTPRIGRSIDVGRVRFRVDVARKLYDALIAPLATSLEGIRQLTIIPDGPLHYLPFDMLVTRSSPRVRYMLEQYETRYAPSLAGVRASVHASDGILAFAGDAVGAEAEVMAIANNTRVRTRVMPVVAAAATERRLREFVKDARIVHFATHATPNDASPLFAYLALSADGSDDGRLHAFEIEQIDFSGRLVVLSGCDTGRGYLAGGEGVLSLSRAFLRSGATGTIATLWPIGQPTPELMAEFYRRLSDGSSPAAALRAAKLVTLQGRYANPLYWAPFVLITA